MSAFDGSKNENVYDHQKIISEGINLFHSIFDFLPESFCAPNYIWGEAVEQALARHRINFIQGTNTQKLPTDYGEKRTIRRNYLGKCNQNHQKYLLRNCSFEPSMNPDKDWVDHCLSDISCAFRWNKPATISTHRVNYIGYLNEENRNRSLSMLDALVNKLLKRWPDVQFITSDQLGQIMEGNG
jgi:hypothetical protein